MQIIKLSNTSISLWVITITTWHYYCWPILLAAQLQIKPLSNKDGDKAVMLTCTSVSEAAEYMASSASKNSDMEEVLSWDVDWVRRLLGGCKETHPLLKGFNVFNEKVVRNGLRETSRAPVLLLIMSLNYPFPLSRVFRPVKIFVYRYCTWWWHWYNSQNSI